MLILIFQVWTTLVMEWGLTWRLPGIMTLTMKILNMNKMVIMVKTRLAKMAKGRKRLQGRTILFLISCSKAQKESKAKYLVLTSSKKTNEIFTFFCDIEAKAKLGKYFVDSFGGCESKIICF